MKRNGTREHGQRTHNGRVVSQAVDRAAGELVDQAAGELVDRAAGELNAERRAGIFRENDT